MPVHQGRAKQVKEFILRWSIRIVGLAVVIGMAWLLWPSPPGHPVSAVATNGKSTLSDKVTLPENVTFDFIMMNYVTPANSNSYTPDVSSRVLTEVMEKSGLGRVVVRPKNSVPILVPKERLHDIEALIGREYMLNLLDFDKDQSK